MSRPIQLTAMEMRRAELDRHAENSARTASCYGQWQTTGWGEVALADVWDFGVTFLAEPAVAYGVAIPADPDDAFADLVKGYFPRTHGGVYDWRCETRGDLVVYTGAFVYFVVDYVGPLAAAAGGVGPDPNYTLHHTLYFEGLGLKDVPTALGDF